jgi:hypothetical protein
VSIAFSLLCFCQQKAPVKSTSAKPVAQQPSTAVKEIEFVPQTDSLITVSQIQTWKKCNPLLDSIAFRYADSFKTTDPTQRLRYQEDFSKAQNKLCILAGLPGGYKEYTWILKNSGNPKNKSVLDSVGIQVK